MNHDAMLSTVDSAARVWKKRLRDFRYKQGESTYSSQENTRVGGWNMAPARTRTSMKLYML